MRDRRLLPADRSIEIRFREFMADDLGTVARIYDVATQPMTTQPWTRFMAAHPRGKYGTVVYELTAFSIDASERRAALRFYQQRFDIPSE